MATTTQRLSTTLSRSSAGGSLGRVLAPWSMTGPVSDVEWKDVPVGADEYRIQSPTATSARVVIPNSTSYRIYDTNYFTRDSRRQKDSTVRRLSFAELQQHMRSRIETGTIYHRNEFVRIGGRMNIQDDPTAGYTS